MRSLSVTSITGLKFGVKATRRHSIMYFWCKTIPESKPPRTKRFSYRVVLIGSYASVLMVLLCALSFCETFAQTTPSPSPSPAIIRSKTPADKPPAPSIPTGSIKGRVIADDGRAFNNAVVLARALNGTMAIKTAPVAADGRFVMDDVPAAVYVIFAIAPGYVDESMTLSDLEQWPRYLIGSQPRIRLVKGGVITGLVTDAKGDPIVGVPVRATTSGGLAAMMSGANGIGIGETDDRGIYRLYGLPPGQYAVKAGGGGQSIRMLSSGYDLDAPTYYPSGSYDTAVPVSVRAGEETVGIDIRYRPTDGYAAKGSVSGKLEQSSISGAVSILLSHAGTTNVLGIGLAGASDQSRTFGFDGLADGEYDLSAVYLTNLNESASAASRRFTIRGADLTDIELVLAPLASISGTIKLEPNSTEVKCNRRESQLIETLIELPRDDPKKLPNKVLATMLGGLGNTLDLNGDFSMRNLEAGVYRPKFKLPTDTWYLRSIDVPATRNVSTPTRPSDPAARTTTAPATVAWQGTLNVKPGEKISGILVTVGQDAAGVRGSLLTQSGGSALPPNLRVHLVPADRENAGNLLRYFESEVDNNGGFTLSNLAPGRYFVLPRVEPTPDLKVARPAFWNTGTRAILRREAEAFNSVLELKPCQQMSELTLKLPN
jgi:hypothetical protein